MQSVSWGAPVISMVGLLFIGIVVYIAVRGLVGLFSGHQSPRQRSAAGPVLAALGFFALGGVVLLTVIKSSRQVENRPVDETVEWVDVVKAVPQKPPINLVPRDSAILPDPAEVTSIAEALEPVIVSDMAVRPAENLQGEPASAQEMVWLPFSKESLAEMLGAEAVEDLLRLRQRLPTGTSASPVIQRVLSPTPVRELLTPPTVQALAIAVAGYLADKTSAQDSVGADALPDVELPEGLASPPHRLAAWVHEKPGLGQTLIDSGEFHELGVPAQEALREAIDNALEKRVTSLCSTEFGIGDDWKKLVDVRISDDAIENVVVKTDREVTEITSAVHGTIPMQKTYALVQFPSDFERRVVLAVRGKLTQTRTLMVATMLGGLWLASVLVSIGSRVAQHGSFLRKVATVPAMALLIVPCLVLSVAIIVAMVNGETLKFPIGHVRVSCSADSGSVANSGQTTGISAFRAD